MTLEVTIHDTFKTVPADEWENLWKRTPQAHVYQTWCWYATWARHFAKPGCIRVLLVHDGGRLVGSAPLYIYTQSFYGFFRRKVLTFLSSYSPVYPLDQGPLIEVEALDKVLATLADRIIKLRGFDVISFELFAPESPTHLLIEELAHRCGRRVDYRACATSHVVELAPAYEDFISTLGSTTRKNIRKYSNRFFAEEGRKIKIVSLPEEMLELLEALCTQKQRRFKCMGRKSTFDNDRFIAFLKDVCTTFLHDGRVLGLMALVDGKIAATQLILLDQHGHCFAYNSSYDLDFTDMRLHYVLENARFEAAIQKGYQQMDLSSGFNHHKEHWSRGNTRDLLEGTLVMRPLGNTSFWLLGQIKAVLKPDKNSPDETSLPNK